MRKHRLEPARSVIAKLGGIDVVSEATGRHVSRIYRWMYPKVQGGTGGLIPQSEAAKLLAFAHANQIPLSAADFFAADTGSEVAA
jgi:hypothetical protein